MAVTTIKQRQLEDGAINDAKVQAGAAIATSKLALNGTIITKDGLVAFTGAQSMGTFKLTNVGTPTPGSSDAARISDVEAAIASIYGIFDSKASVRVATTAAGTLASSFENADTVDGVTLATGDRILIKNQSSGSENGIYVVAASGAPTRATDFDAWTEIPGSYVAVEVGTTNADTVWLSTADAGGTINSTSITFTQLGSGGGYTTSNFVDKEVPSGSINSSNVTYTLANTPTSGSEHVFLNGVLQESGSGNDYTISGATITFLAAPLTGDKLRVSSRK